MPKAILELEMPRNCKNCPLKYYLDYSERNYPWEDYVCTITGKGIAGKGRRSDCPLKQAENEQLRARVARMREALTIANNYMPDIGQFCACGKCKTCGADINYAGYEHCVKCARGIIDAALSDTPADYHNPADIEALRHAREAIKAAWSDGSANAAMDKANKALAAIDKAIGGKAHE